VDSVRSYFLAEGPLLKDANFEMSSLIEHHNKIICDSYGKHPTFPLKTFCSQHVIQDNWEKDLKEKGWYSLTDVKRSIEKPVRL
jgi:hypothetical protein